MPTRADRFCPKCRAVRPGSSPAHLVHPRTGELMVFDEDSLARCPDCGTVWERTDKGIEFLDQARQPE
jgi:hypothetical protein